jgi:hypothetical protein
MRILLSIAFFSSLFIGNLHSQSADNIVYITKSGTKYHQGNCRYLKSSKIETDCSALSAKYSACSVCRPDCNLESTPAENPSIHTAPADESSESAPALESEPSSSSSSIKAVQCSSTTQAGNRCKRNTSNSSGKCWQHE